jgi:EmrB/QacA subfamily drug resistance transporter
MYERRTVKGVAGNDEPLGREVWIVSAVVVIGVVMSILDTTIVNVALETLSRELDAPLNTIQWVATGYLLALATVIPLTGWMTERFGSKRIWMISVSLFGLGSTLCGLAWSAESLIFFRVLQGFGGGMIMPVGMALLAQTAGPGRVGRVMSVIGVPMLLGPILGPVVGGLIVDSVSWRWIFYVNVPIAIVALMLAAKLLKADAGRADAGKLDWVGLLLLSPGLALFVFGLSESESHGGFTHPLVWGPIIAGVVLVVAFVLHSLRATRPLIDVRLFRVRTFSAAAATTFLVGGALFGAMIILPLYYQVARGEDALTAGLLMAPQGLGAALAMPLAGRLTDRVGGGLVALVGLTILTLGTIPFAFIDSSSSYTLLAFLLVLRGLGIGGSMMPAMAAAYATLERADVPRATSSLNALQRIGGSIGTAVLAVVLQGQIKDQLASAQVGESAPAASGTLERLPEDLRQRLAEPLAAAFAATFWWAVGISVLALIPATILAVAQRRERIQSGEGAEPLAEPEQIPA